MNTLVDSQHADARLHEYEQAERLVREHLAQVDDTDFNVIFNQGWVRLHGNRAELPDGPDYVQVQKRHHATGRSSPNHAIATQKLTWQSFQG